MHIRYNHNLPVLGIGLVPWGRLGPERWLQDYRIATLYDWDMTIPGVPPVHAVTRVYPNVQLERLNSQRLVDHPSFQRMLQEDLAGYHVLTYKPVQRPEALSNFDFINRDQPIAARLEDKQYFRELMHDLIPFPKYALYDRSELTAADASKILDGRSTVIVQDSRLSGGKGTFVVSDGASLEYALSSMDRMKGSGRLVVSERIAHAYERSVQACVTKHGTFVGPLQKQIIADPLLANLSVADGDKFCGAEITPHDRWAAAHPEIKKYALLVGEKIRSLGYRGIFSLDCLLDVSGRVYTLEINPRITGITPLLTMLHREGQDIPFYLLHILELAGVDYEIVDDAIDPVGPEGSLLMMHSQESTQVKMVHSPQSGLYDPATMQCIEPAIRLQKPDQLLVQQYIPSSVIVKPGGRLLTAYANTRALDDNDQLLPATEFQVKELMKQVEVERA